MKLEYKGIQIFYTTKGKGDAIILLHGFLENSNMWKDLANQISKTHLVVTIDLLGHGKTGCIGYLHTMEMMAEAVYAVVTKLKIKKAIFIGHSMGGYVALAYADMFTKKVEGLCLMNSTTIEDSFEKKQNRDRAILALKHNYKTFIRVSIANLFRPKNRIVFSKEIKLIIEEALLMPLQGIIAALEGMKIRKNRTYVLDVTSFKKMIIIGKKDPVLDYNLLISLANRHNIETVIVPDGHMSYIENKEEITYKILHFIEK